MARTWLDDLRDAEQRGERWVRERQAQAAQLEGDVAARGRAAWDAAVRKAADLAEHAPQELQAIGGRVADAFGQNKVPIANPKTGVKGPSSHRSSGHPASSRETSPPKRPSSLGDALWEGALQADTALRSAANVMTFSGADHLSAGLDALFQPGGLGGWERRYETNLAHEQARDRYDAEHRRGSTTAGQIAGTMLGVASAFPAEGVAFLAPRLVGATKLTGREAAALLGGGGAMGAGTQAVSDFASGKMSGLGDYAGSALGGVAGVAAAPFVGPGRAGAVDGWVTSAAGDALSGRTVSLDRAAQNAAAGGIFGKVIGSVGRRISDGFVTNAKGKLGELMGDLRSKINAEPRDPVPKTRDKLKKSYWVPDGRRGDVRFEDKFGYGADLRPNQRRARVELGPNFQLNHFTPDDIGLFFGMPASMEGAQYADHLRRRR